MKQLLYSIAAGLVVYEACALKNDKSGDTISELAWGAPPIVPFLAGVLAGHLFWQSSSTK